MKEGHAASLASCFLFPILLLSYFGLQARMTGSGGKKGGEDFCPEKKAEFRVDRYL